VLCLFSLFFLGFQREGGAKMAPGTIGVPAHLNFRRRAHRAPRPGMVHASIVSVNAGRTLRLSVRVRAMPEAARGYAQIKLTSE
jgi:hypothetical protein